MMKALEKDKKNNKKSMKVILTKGIGKMFIKFSYHFDKFFESIVTLSSSFCTIKIF